MHNAPWNEGGGGSTTSCLFVSAINCASTVDQTALNEEIQSANWISMEGGIGGVNCQGTSTCEWTWSLGAMFQYVNYVHSLGTNISYSSYATDTANDANIGWSFPNYSDDIEYNLAGYLLTNNGNDLVADGAEMPVSTVYDGTTYNQLWAGYSRDLGNATGSMNFVNDTYYERTFTNGVVLLYPPELPGASNSINVTLPSLPAGETYYDYYPTTSSYSNGTTYNIAGGSTVQLTAGAGLVLSIKST
jgi:hypothetical protein